jgi:hypothetical protein
MTLSLSKAYAPSALQAANSSAYNTDISALFNAFSGLEAQTSTLGGLTITPSSNGDRFKVTNAAGTTIFNVDTTNTCVEIAATYKLCLDGGGDTYIAETSANVMSFYAAGNVQFGLQSTLAWIPATNKLCLDGGGDTFIQESSANVMSFYAAAGKQLDIQSEYAFFQGNVSVPATKKLYLDGGGDTYIKEASANVMEIYAAGSKEITVQSQYVFVAHNLVTGSIVAQTEGVDNIGGATGYFNDISYKTLTDRGCLGWFDEGVELQDGRKVSDTEALLAIKKHSKKKTVYGVEMLDYKTFPKVSYIKARENNGALIDRNEDDEPVKGVDGVEMTSMFSIMIGAIKELTLRVKALEAK